MRTNIDENAVCEKCGTVPILNHELEAFKANLSVYKWVSIILLLMVVSNFVSNLVGAEREIRDRLAEIEAGQNQIKAAVVKAEKEFEK